MEVTKTTIAIIVAMVALIGLCPFGFAAWAPVGASMLTTGIVGLVVLAIYKIFTN